MASYRSTFGDLLEPGFREIFNDAFKEMPMVAEKIYRVGKSSKQDEKDSGVTGFGLLQETAEGGSVDYEDPVTKIAAYGSNIIRKLFNLRESLYEIIRSQTQKWGGSETIIRASYL